MIAFADIQDRILPMRTDKFPREGQLAFQVAARRLCKETFALQEVAEFTMPANTVYMDPYVPATDYKDSLYIFKAEYQKPDLTWAPLRILNEVQLEDTTRHAFNSPGLMKAYTSQNGKFYPNRPPAIDTQVRGVIAYVPLGDFDEIDFPVEFEDALVQGALSHLMRHPGKDKDLKMAEVCEAAFLAMASGFRGSTLIGDVGYARASRKVNRHRQGFLHQDTLRY